MKLKALALAGATITLASAPAFGATALVDPGFEDAANFIATGSGVEKWEPFFGPGSVTSEVSTLSPRTGASHARLLLGDSANSFVGFFQDIEVNPGDFITFEGYHSAANNDPSAIEIRIEWRPNSTDPSEIDRVDQNGGTPGTDYELFSLSGTAPDGTGVARVVYNLQSFGGSAAAEANVDDFSVTGSTVPEPSGAILLSLGALGLVVRRKRA